MNLIKFIRGLYRFQKQRQSLVNRDNFARFNLMNI